MPVPRLLTGTRRALLGRGQFDPTQVPGLQSWFRPEQGVYSGNAASFVAASSQWLSRASNASLQMGAGVRCTIAGWVWLTADVNNDLLSKWATPEYLVIYNGANHRFEFYVSADGVGNSSVTANNFGVPSTGTWYFLCCQYDGTNISISVNNGTPNTTPYSSDIFSSTSAFNLGARNGAGNFTGGRLDAWAIWKRVLTPAEIASLYNGGVGLRYQQLPASLLTSLISWWDLEQPSGTRPDSVVASANDLTSNNSVGIADGVSPYRAATVVAASSQSLSRADNASLSTGAISFSVSAWVFLASKPGAGGIVTKRNAAGVGEYDLGYYGGATDRFKFRTFNGGAEVGNATANSFGAPSLNTWYHIVAIHDSANSLIKIVVNNGTVDSAATTGNPADTAAAFFIGAYNDPASFFDGRIDEVGFWKRVLTPAEIAQLYNSGVGVQYAQLNDGLKTNLVSWWDLEEASGSRVDAVVASGNDLTANNTPGSDVGATAYVTRAVDGDAVRLWTTSYGSANIIQATATKRALYKAAILNSMPVIRFDGVDDEFSTIPLAAAIPTLIIVARQNSAPGAAEKVLFEFLGGTPNRAAWETFNGISVTNYVWVHNSGVAGVNLTMGNQTFHVLVAAVASASSFIPWSDGVAIAGFDPADAVTTFTGLAIGAGGGARWGDNDVAEVLYYNRPLSTREIHQLTDYLGAKYGIVVTH